MEFKKLVYLLLMLGCLTASLAFSFDKKVKFYTKFRYLLPAVLFTGFVFIIWDIRFDEVGIWRFNPEFLSGIFILGLPVEEWLFFLVFPYMCVLIYEFLVYKLPHFEKPNLFLAVSLVLLVVFILLAYFNRQKLYTFFNFFLLSVYFGYTVFRNRFKQHYTKFYLTWFIALIPFFIVQRVVLTLPALEYNSEHITGVKILSIPVEDFFYLFLLLVMNLTIYEYMKKQTFRKISLR